MVGFIFFSLTADEIIGWVSWFYFFCFRVKTSSRLNNEDYFVENVCVHIDVDALYQ